MESLYVFSDCTMTGSLRNPGVVLCVLYPHWFGLWAESLGGHCLLLAILIDGYKNLTPSGHTTII